MKALAVNGAEIHYADRGDGAPLLLVHGFPLDHSMWDAMNPSAAAVRAIAPDLPGFGLSPPRGETATMEQFADDLAGLLDALEIDEPVVFCGLSMGGYIALQFERKYRRRLRGLVICDSRAAADSPAAAQTRGLLAERVLREGVDPIIETMTPRLLAEKTKRENPRLIERLRRMMAASDRRGVAAALRGMAARPDMTAAIAEISCPTLLVVGDEDVLTPPAEMRSMAETIPGARFVEIPGAGHLAPLEAPAAVAAALAEFLRDIV